MIAASRAEAKAAGSTRYFTGQACPRGHVALRITRSGGCAECDKAYNSAWKKRNPKKHARINREWRAANLDAVRASERACAARQPIEAKRKRSRQFAARHPERVYANTARQRAKRFSRVPAWAEHDKIRTVYRQAAKLSSTGSQHHVDHVFPLQGKLVSGLHVHTNLRVLPGALNVRKANKFRPFSEVL